MSVIKTDSSYVCAHEPQEGDRWFRLWLGGQPRQLLPIDQYESVLRWALAISRQFTLPIELVPVSAPDAAKFLGPRHEMTPEERHQVRQDVVTTCAAVMRDCPDPQVRADAYSLLTDMKVVRP